MVIMLKDWILAPPTLLGPYEGSPAMQAGLNSAPTGLNSLTTLNKRLNKQLNTAITYHNSGIIYRYNNYNL